MNEVTAKILEKFIILSLTHRADKIKGLEMVTKIYAVRVVESHIAHNDLCREEEYFTIPKYYVMEKYHHPKPVKKTCGGEYLKRTEGHDCFKVAYKRVRSTTATSLSCSCVNV